MASFYFDRIPMADATQHGIDSTVKSLSHADRIELSANSQNLL
jgi:hypothetical protein